MFVLNFSYKNTLLTYSCSILVNLKVLKETESSLNTQQSEADVQIVANQSITQVEMYKYISVT